MKISEKEKKMLLYLAGLIVVVFSFQFGFSPKQNDNLNLENQISTLKNDVNQLKIKVAKQQEYETKTEETKVEIEKILSQFPGYFQEEDGILYASKLEKVNNMKISNVTLGQASVLYGDETAIAESEENMTGNTAVSTFSGRTLYKIPLTMEYTSSYKDLKECMEMIKKEESRKSMDTVSMSYDAATGKLIGNFVVNAYYLKDKEQSYDTPDIPGMGTGVKNIFGTVK